MKTLFTNNNQNFFSIGGQVHNSSSYSKNTIKKACLAINKMHMNTIAAPVYWEQLEPKEGIFDFTQVDMLIDTARENDLKLVLLWFGSWKNGASHYVPAWVKTDKKRFLWACTPSGIPIRSLSPVCKNSCEADKTAFCQLLSHIKLSDPSLQTVISVQVENEPGLMGSPRDYSSFANELFNHSVPSELIDWLSSSPDNEITSVWKTHGAYTQGSWPEIFGKFRAADIFSAYLFSNYINTIAKAGKEILNIPLYVNVWLGELFTQTPGIHYPSGGAVGNVLSLWKHYTPDIDAICPDIYVQDADTYRTVCSEYCRTDNILYIPESSPTDLNAAHVFYQIEKNNLSGIHIFGVDSTIQSDGSICESAKDYYRTVQILNSCKPLLECSNNEWIIKSVAQYEGADYQLIDFGTYYCYVNYFLKSNGSSGLRELPLDTDHQDNSTNLVRAKGLIFYNGKNEFFMAGEGFTVTILEKNSIETISTGMSFSDFQKNIRIPYLSVAEGYLDTDKKFQINKIRTGDEIDFGLWVNHDIGLLYVQLEDL